MNIKIQLNHEGTKDTKAMVVLYPNDFQSTREHLQRVLAGATPERIRAAIKAGMTPYESGKHRKWRPLAAQRRKR